ncbi:crossover junction endodeoxyribonuclease RuvC [Parasphingopyxis algicola]|uniref:crossover junction endodeoxyribonuclease RuvC n=1 Tax=Parasphingopyxis algicola TaxID=2026624 RepID=UPI0015A05880|nr:crossover junction endodeoxyribonuclease RuvC [Parasphingopyxis algicola]QLC26928.1 crossover junction endodeoxyribonuclease RuvC [Parasphingopyxis algicola]
MKLIGLDPGLACTGWGVIAAEGNRLSHIANGQIRTDAKAPMAARLVTLADGLRAVLADHAPVDAGIEEVFVNSNAQSTLKLGQARGALMLVLAEAGLPIGEYAPRLVKKAVVGTGGADKAQIHAMVSVLLPGAQIAGADAADALAVAIAHAHHRASAKAVEPALSKAEGRAA